MEHQQRFHTYARQLISAREEERKRLARDLHDDIASRLLLLTRGIEAIEEQSASQNAVFREGLAKLRLQAVEALEAVRRTAQGLRPRILDDLGLVAAIEWLAEEAEKHGPFTVSVSTTGLENEPPSEAGIALFRITQEALANISKHAGARHVDIGISGSPEAIKIVISDDGKGFLISEKAGGYVSEGRMGLIGMEERARLLGGTFALHSEPGKGAQITVRLPLDYDENG